MTSNNSDNASFSIGAVSKATEIPASTLRTWERRYGFPDPDRTEGGHRCYRTEDVERLRLIARAIDEDHRPSDVVPMAPEKLRALLEPDEASGGQGSTDRIAPVDSNRRPEVPSGIARPDEGGEPPEWLTRWREMVLELDGESLQTELETEWNRLGGLEFIEERLCPLLVDIGREWAVGNLGLVHEHHASEHIQDFLSSRWRPLSERNRGPVAMCATLPSEDHVIGLHIATLLLAMAGWRIVFIGPRTPTSHLAEAANEDTVDAVVVSFSECYAPENADRAIATLRERLPDSVDLVTGGRGAPDVGNTVSFSKLRPFYEWAEERVGARTGPRE